MNIRKAGIEDYEKIKPFKLLSKKEELKYSETLKPLEETEEKYLEYLKNDLNKLWRVFFIAEEDNKIIGIIQVKKYKTISISKFEWKGYMSNLYIDKNHRGKGIAQKLFQACFDWLKENKVHHISLEIHKDNKIALQLANKMGFKEYTVKMTKEI